MDSLLSTSPKKIPETTVYICNMSEDVWPFICAMSNSHARLLEIEENADLGDRDLFGFAGEDNVIFVMPRPIHDDFLAYYTDLFGKKNFRFFVPKVHTGAICEDILKDESILQVLVDAANGSKRIEITSYSTTLQFLELVRYLRKKGLTVTTPDAPEEEDAWTVNFYGSKSGIRQLAQQSGAKEPDFVMPEGLVCSGIVDAAKIAAKKYIKEHGVVVKTNKGHSGAGVLLLREGDLPNDYEVCDQAILTLLKKDAYWNMFPIVIESYIALNPSLGGGSPNVEFKILKNGHVDLLYYGGMRITKDGVFRGMEIHNDVISDQATARMVDTGFFIAEQYRAAGYRGYFDVDFVAAKNGELYVTESNVRRTGGTHVYTTALKLFGKDLMHERYILSNNSHEFPEHKTFTFSSLLELLRPILFSKETKEGIILVSENMLSYHRISYIIFAHNKKHAYDIEAQMEALLIA